MNIVDRLTIWLTAGFSGEEARRLLTLATDMEMVPDLFPGNDRSVLRQVAILLLAWSWDTPMVLHNLLAEQRPRKADGLVAVLRREG